MNITIASALVRNQGIKCKHFTYTLVQLQPNNIIKVVTDDKRHYTITVKRDGTITSKQDETP